MSACHSIFENGYGHGKKGNIFEHKLSSIDLKLFPISVPGYCYSKIKCSSETVTKRERLSFPKQNLAPTPGIKTTKSLEVAI